MPVLPFDPVQAIAHLRASDPDFARLIEVIGAFRMELKPTGTLFAALAEAIVYQQLHGKAAATIYGRVCALCPDARGGPTAEVIMRLSDEALRGAGLSRSKLLAMRDLGARTIEGSLPSFAALRKMTDEAIIDALTEVRGIGRWTTEMVLMFRLGRPDVLPVDDFGIRKGFIVAFRKRKMPTRESITARGRKWAPYRTAASWYLWRAAALEKMPGPIKSSTI